MRTPDAGERNLWTFSKRHLFTVRGFITVEGPVTGEDIRRLAICSGLNQFRQPLQQQEALVEIAALPEGLVYLAHIHNTIVGYITFHRPQFERWTNTGLDIMELGAIEVSRYWRDMGIAGALVQIPFATDFLEDKIIISLECYWFWDLHGKRINTWQYRRLMQKLLEKAGFQTMLTDDPDICDHPANLLQVRFGSQVPKEVFPRFEAICYQGKKQ
ncbi:MAG: N-acetyltransferase [Dethiobacteraceae bacterium]|jgi:acetoin utilization protein AcuA|nr:N-acetyltransferase [Bacillota bacterium]